MHIIQDIHKPVATNPVLLIDKVVVTVVSEPVGCDKNHYDVKPPQVVQQVNRTHIMATACTCGAISSSFWWL
jgi:hypothetical protein